jgi:tRNA (guanine37-N1)-methyltransferase
MRFDVLTIFPRMLSSYLEEGILGRAVKAGIVDVRIVNIRDFARGPHKTTDDRPYGGGNGMVMKAGPIHRALASVKRVSESSRVVLLSPQGDTFTQALAGELSRLDQLILVCGRYEGVDERIKLVSIDREISIGDFVLSGGELGALCIIEAVSRLIPGVLGGERSHLEDSFNEGLLEYPQYTRPRIFEGRAVPEILLSGDHEKIRKWRREESLKRTLKKRPDLIEKAKLSQEDKSIIAKLEKN